MFWVVFIGLILIAGVFEMLSSTFYASRPVDGADPGPVETPGEAKEKETVQ